MAWNPDHRRKTKLLFVRVTPEDLALLKEAAQIEERVLADWVRRTLKRRAKATLERKRGDGASTDHDQQRRRD